MSIFRKVPCYGAGLPDYGNQVNSVVASAIMEAQPFADVLHWQHPNREQCLQWGWRFLLGM